MNQLTIEQLKSLEVGDWVYLTNADRMYGTYVKKLSTSDDEGFAWENIETLEKYKYNEYSIDWLAFRNKQEAEAKGEIVEFNCKLGDTVYFYDFTKHEVMQGKVIGLRLNYYTPSNPIWVRVQFDIPMVKKDCVTEVWASMVFTDKSEAERRLA